MAETSDDTVSEFRSLRESELEGWFDHCAAVFVNTPRAYFVRHWENDPSRDINGIQVAVHNGKIVSTVRVFFRQMYLNGESVLVGGIGEVSTKPEYRRQKLASKLLVSAIKYMEERKVLLSMLHTGSAAPLYASLGWVSTPSRLRIKSWSVEQSSITTDLKVEEFDFEDAKSLQTIISIYDQFSKHLNGVWTRKEEVYWQRWIKAEVKEVSWKSKGAKHGITLWIGNDQEKFGYLIGLVQETKHELDVIEFCVKDGLASTQIKTYFSQLVNYAIQKYDSSTGEWTVSYPLPFETLVFKDAAEGNIKSDEGLMIKWIGDVNKQENLKDIVFWHLDGF